MEWPEWPCGSLAPARIILLSLHSPDLGPSHPTDSPMTANRLGEGGVGRRLSTSVVRGDGWFAAVVGGAIALPLSIIFHELGHFGAFTGFGFPDAVLRSTSASWAGSGEFKMLFRAGDMEAAAALAEPWKIAVGSAAGPMISYLTAIACVLAVRRFGPGPFSLVLGLGLAAPLQGVAAFPVLAMNLFGGGFTGNQDEVWVAWLTGIPSSLAVLPGLACLLLGHWLLVRAIPRDRRLQVLAPTIGGMVLGGCLWILWLGPLVLP